MNGFLKKFQIFPFHFILVTLFFTADGYDDYIGLIPFTDLFLYFVAVAIISIILYFLFAFIFKSSFKAGIFTTFILVGFLFYGVFQDVLEKSKFLSSISRDHILFPIFCVLIIIVFFLIRYSRRLFAKTTYYLNITFLIYLLVDIGFIFVKWPGEEKNNSVKNQKIQEGNICTACKKPDIFFIVTDEYSGEAVLKKYFNYDNSGYAAFFRNKGFFVPSASSSNYSYTPFSMAATFDMRYLDWISRSADITAKHYTVAAKQITDSRAVNILKSAGYTFKNYSIFDIGDQPSPFDQDFLSLKLKLITAKTMLERIRKSMFWGMDIREGQTVKWLQNKTSKVGAGNQRMINLTEGVAGEKRDQPTFIYTHLMMPHFPFLFDSTGRAVDQASEQKNIQKPDKKYLSYLVYTNNVIKKMVTDIFEKQKGQAIIIVMSDHGYRDIGTDDCRELNTNFSAIYIPGGDYQYFYNDMSNVNLFPTLFHTIFEQGFPLIKDSCIF